MQHFATPKGAFDPASLGKHCQPLQRFYDVSPPPPRRSHADCPVPLPSTHVSWNTVPALPYNGSEVFAYLNCTSVYVT